MVESLHAGPDLLLFVAVFPGAFRPCFGLIRGVSNTGRLSLSFSVLVLRGKCTVRIQWQYPQYPVKVISAEGAQALIDTPLLSMGKPLVTTLSQELSRLS